MSQGSFHNLPHQLELPFEGRFEHCPTCSPSEDPREDFLRSMCLRHWRELEASFNPSEFKKVVDAALEQGRAEAEACYWIVRPHSSTSIPYCGI